MHSRPAPVAGCNRKRCPFQVGTAFFVFAGFVRMSSFSHTSTTPPEAALDGAPPWARALVREVKELREEVQALRQADTGGEANTDPLTLSMNDAADRLGISRRTLDTLCAAGEVTSIKVGRRRLVPVGALDAYIRRKADE